MGKFHSISYVLQAEEVEMPHCTLFAILLYYAFKKATLLQTTSSMYIHLIVD